VDILTRFADSAWTIEGEVDGRHHSVAIMAEGARPAHPLIAQALHGLGRVDKETAIANAAFIVKAVNCHDELVAAAKDAFKYGVMPHSPSWLILKAALSKADPQ
jgi:hypothetical protein